MTSPPRGDSQSPQKGRKGMISACDQSPQEGHPYLPDPMRAAAARRDPLGLPTDSNAIARSGPMARDDSMPSAEWAFGPNKQQAKSMTPDQLQAARARVRVEMLRAMGQKPMRIIEDTEE